MEAEAHSCVRSSELERVREMTGIELHALKLTVEKSTYEDKWRPGEPSLVRVKCILQPQLSPSKLEVHTIYGGRGKVANQ